MITIKEMMDMANLILNYPKARKPVIKKALKEVRMIEAGVIPRKSARDFLKESRNDKKHDE